jgi:hypothetical protein
VARAILYNDHGKPAYRQTRFYQRTAAGWQRTAPVAALWGAKRSLETTYFVFHLRQQDAPVVIAAAPQLDTLYTTLAHNLGLPRRPTTKKLVIDVSVTQPPGHTLPWFGVPERIRVPSPAVYRAPVELTDSELLAQSITLPLLEHVLAQRREQHQTGLAWQPMLSGLRLWQVWDLDLPLSVWREDVVKWIYRDLPARRPGQAVVLPERYTDLCAAHMLWLKSPLQLHLPLFCTEFDQTQWRFYWKVSADPSTRLDQLIVPVDPDEYFADTNNYVHKLSRPGQTVALATLIEYAVATYGRERLPVLVASLGQYERWDTLLPAVYGVSPAEFEAGWQAYLAAQYGILTPVNRNP